MKPIALVFLLIACSIAPMLEITEESELIEYNIMNSGSGINGASVSPISGTMAGGQNLTITGNGFLSKATNSLTNDGLTHSWSMSVADSIQGGYGESGGPQPFSHIFAPTSGADQALVYYTDIRFLVPTSIDKLRSITGASGADRGRMREAFANMTGADPMTGLSINDLCLPFLADMGENSWQTGTGLNEDEIIVEVTMAVNPAVVWKNLLEPTTREVFDLPKGKKGTAANVWGDVLINDEPLHEKLVKDGQGHYLDILKLAYYWSHNKSKDVHGLD